MIIPVVTFVLALCGIMALFVFKHREVTTGRVVAPRTREHLDKNAHRLKDLLVAAESDLSRIPPEFVNFVRTLIQALALLGARGARFFESQLHRVADLVSHKHRYERPAAPRSEFLNKIVEHKNGEGKRKDTVPIEPDLRDN